MSSFPVEMGMFHVPEKQLKMGIDLSNKIAICTWIRGHHAGMPRVSNWSLGSYIVKYLNHESMKTSRVALVLQLGQLSLQVYAGESPVVVGPAQFVSAMIRRPSWE